MALDVASDDTLAGIQVEGTDDALDLEVYAEGSNGGPGVVIRGLQMKSRKQPNVWAKSALLEIVQRWAVLPLSAHSEFVFRTDGKLGPSGVAVAEALDAARGGDPTRIAGLLGVGVNDPVCATLARASVVSEPGSVEALLLAAEQEVRARLTISATHPDAVREAEERVNKLFTLISTKSGLPNEGDRFISRRAILDVLGGVSQLPAKDRWTDGLGPEYAAMVMADDVAGVLVPPICMTWRGAKLSIADLAGLAGPVVLSGRTGSGKSTVARLWRTDAAAGGGQVVVCQAEGYLPGRLDRAIADALGDIVGRTLPRIVGQQALSDSNATVVIDGISEVPTDVRSELAKELQVHFAGGYGARVVLMGRDESVCIGALPPSITAERVYPKSFGHAQRLELTATVLSEGAVDIPHSENEADFTHHCRVALAQVEHALRDAAGNPMLLRMALHLVASGTSFTDRASVYESTVERMAARRNVADIRIASSALGIVFARLMDEGRRYANPLEWARLFKEASEVLASVGVATTASEVREAIDRSGLVTAVTAGHSSRVLVPVHDSFADYFSARAHADGLVSLPAVMTANDENRILLSAQMNMLDIEQCLAVAVQLPFTLVRLSESDHAEVGDGAPESVAALLNNLLPGSTPVGVTMWRAQEGGVIAQAGAADTGWVQNADAPAIYTAPTAVSERTDGPVTIAVRLWRLILRQRLRRADRLRDKAPKSREEACSQLAAHIEQTVNAYEQILPQVAPPAALERLTQAVGPMGMTGVIYERQASDIGPGYWPLQYRHTVDINLSAATEDLPSSGITTRDFTASGDVESHLSISPEKTAAKRISDAITKLTRPHWL